MRYVVLSDAHGNKPYFERCIRHIDAMNPEQIIYLGDAYGYFDDGDYVIDELRERGAKILKGNHEAMLLGEIFLDDEKDRLYHLKEKRNSISTDKMMFLKDLTSSYETVISDKRCLFVHGTIDNPLLGYMYEDDCFYEELNYEYVFMGHTHRPYVKKVGATVYVNVGSCGLPRDNGNKPSFCVFDGAFENLFILRETINLDMIEKKYYFNVDKRVIDVLRRKDK